MSAGQVYLARHGRTAYNLEGRFQGQGPVPLDEVGRAQASELAGQAAAHGFRALWSSPLRRALETAEIVAGRLELEPRLDARLMETDAGDWTDRTFAEIQATSPLLFQGFASGDPAFGFPGGESFAHQAVRVAEALLDVEAGELPALVVCHGGVIRIALRQRSPDPAKAVTPVANGALVPLDAVPPEGPSDAASLEESVSG